MGPTLILGPWVGYDDVAMVQTKSEYVLSKGLGGAMIWALDLDDFTNRCGTGTYPLLKTINRVLRGYSKILRQSDSLLEYGVKVLISLGGWNDSAGDKYHRLATDPAARANFITNALAFVNQYGFGGIDLDWEYPSLSTGKIVKFLNMIWIFFYFNKHYNYCSDEYSGDKDGFTAWVQELVEAFHPEGLLVTAAVSGSYQRIDTSYDVPAISAYLDLINVMTYDYHGSWDRQTGHVSPLYAHPDDVDPLFNTNSSIDIWIDKGADPLKLTLGIPMYGQCFTLADPSVNGLNAPTVGGCNAGEYTRQMGFLAYYEICNNVEQGWTVVQDPLGTMGPYAYSGNQWVSYDDVAMVRIKCFFNAFPKKKVVCVFTNWAWYRPDIGKFTPEDIDPDLCTHINYAFATLDPDELIMKPYDSWSDIDNGKYHRLVTDPAARANFVSSALEFVNQYSFGGIDLDLAYCPQDVPNEDKEGFIALIQELYEAFHPEGLLVTATVSGNYEIIEACYDVPTMSTYLDHMNVMTYDYHGSWDRKTGHVSPLYAHPDDVDPYLNTNYSITLWIEKGADPLKVIMGFPMYGQSFTLADASNHGLNAPTYGGGEAGPYTRQMGFLAYYEVSLFSSLLFI
ncbi:putative chitinase 3 [Armadillidium vulgare]|nr:putative chitinase 3 [Armadillidium vulgare]